MFGTTARHQTHFQHHHFPNHARGPAITPTAVSPESAKAGDLFDDFIAASTFKSVLHNYRLICDVLKLRPTNFRQFYPKLKSKIRTWKAQALWSKYDKRSSHKCYNQGKAAVNSKVLIIGAGPCGLRAAIEAQLLGAKVVVVEKRDRFSRNNVLHLWPFVITDLKALGAKKFYGKFCAGAIDHISIRQLQCILLKVALLLGVEIIAGVAFEELLQPPDDQSQRTGWHGKFNPPQHRVNHYEFDVLIGADGKRNTLLGFKRKEFRGKLAIAITANFINRHSEQEACVQEISGVAFIFNQKFFKELYAETGIDLENIVYYKDETHYFVMTAKKHSLIDKGVIMTDYSDIVQLLHPTNVDREALCRYAREAANFSTNYLLPHTDFAVNHYGKPDIAMFDFTSMFAAENSCRVREKHGHKLLKLLVGDSLLEPFWPIGSGCARGFLSCFDACWAIRSWASDSMTPLEVLAERESSHRLLGQTTPENLSKDITSYTLEPSSRYPTINLKSVLPYQVRHLCGMEQLEEDIQQLELSRKRKRRDSIMQPDTLLAWCQKQVENHGDVPLEDLDMSFKNGIALCAIIHRYRPFYIDFPALDKNNFTGNNQLAFDILEKEFGIPPVMTGNEMAACTIPDRLAMISYLSQVCDVFRGQIPQYMGDKKNEEGCPDLDDFPMPAEDELPTTNLVKSETSRSEGNLIKCKMLNTKENISKEDLYRTKKRRSEVGSLDKLNKELLKPTAEQTENFTGRVKVMEDKINVGDGKIQKPKDMVRAIGKLEKSDWNMAAIQRKINENTIPLVSNKTDKIPKWNKDSYNDKQLSIEKRLRENGEDEDRIAKYLDIDASLKRIERKLKEGSTLEVGQRGHNKVSNLANQLASKLVRKDDSKTSLTKQSKTVILPTSNSDLCYFCSTRVYLVERMSAEGKFFHRKCFKCSYCHALLRLGNYIYDREGRYGGHFFCIPHFGMSPKEEHKQMNIPLMPYSNKAQLKEDLKKNSTNSLYLDASLVDGRGTTPERAEFENSVVEQSDEDEYLSEDEWTDRNFGMSANELDETDSECSDFGDDDDEQLEYELDYQISAEETKRLAEKWKRRYSSNRTPASALSDSDDLSEERGADGDESHTATEGEYEDDVEDDGEVIKNARALRRQELNINVHPPIMHTSDSGSDTEVATDSEESDTHIDTDSEFAEDSRHAEVPKITINESVASDSSDSKEKVPEEPTKTFREEEQIVPPSEPNPHTEHLQRLLRRTESNEAMVARRNLLLRTNYLLGNGNQVPKRSASSADVGNHFKNFMDKISANQTKLKPAANPSPSMQAFLNSSKGTSLISTPYGFERTEFNERPRLSIVNMGSGSTFYNSSNKAEKFTSKLSSTSSDNFSIFSENDLPQHNAAQEHNTTTDSVSPCEHTSKNNNVPFIVSSPCDNYSPSDLFGKEVKRISLSADAKNSGVSRKMFDFRLGDEVVEAINEEIMTSSVKSSDEEIQSDGNQEEVIVVTEKNSSKEDINRDHDSSEKLLLNCCNNTLESEVHELATELNSKENGNVSTPDNLFRARVIPLIDEFPDKPITSIESQNNSIQIDENIYCTPAQVETVPNMFSLYQNAKLSNYANNDEITFLDCVGDSKVPKYLTEKTSSNSAKDLSISSEYCDEKDIDSVFDQLAGEALNDLRQCEDPNFAEFQSVDDISEINYISENIPFVMPKIVDKLEKDIVIDDPGSKLEQEELIDMDEEFGWAEENALDSAGEEFNVSEIQHTEKCIDRAVPVSQTNNLVEAENIEYMDTSSESSSSESSETFSYNPLEDVHSPLTNEQTEVVNFPIVSSLSHSSITQNINKCVEKSRSFDGKKLFGEVHHISEKTPENSYPTGSYKSPSGPSPGRYEGYIPRFKDRVTPFRYVRDSIDVRKSASSKPLFTPVPQVSVECGKKTDSYKAIETDLSPSAKTNCKPKDGDLVRDMVMSRITKPDKTNRRGSRGSLLLSSGSRSSLFGEDGPDTSGSLGDLRSYTDSNVNISSVSDKSNENFQIDLKKKDNLTEPNRNFLFKDYKKNLKNILPATELSNPNKSIQQSNGRHQKAVSSGPSADNFEYNTLDEDSHLINRKKSMALRRRTLDTFDPRMPSIETVQSGATDSRTVRHLDSPRPADCSSSSRQLEIFSPRSPINSHQPDTFTAHPISFVYDRPRRASESEVESVHSDVASESNKSVSQWNVTVLSDKEVRLKKLLSEHRKKEFEASKGKNVESCVRDCLQEYRQKRYSAPVPNLIGVGSGKENIRDDIYQKNSKRPSVLELEALHVFTASSKEVEPQASVIPQGNPQPELRKQKKSKDRERRRSLIQVVAGMFNKSDDKKKCDEKSPKEVSSNIEASSSESYTSPKSPSVRERFSKLRLSKPKEKAPDRTEGESPRREVNHGSQSPPFATPSPRNLFSFLTKSTDKKVQPSEENEDELLNGSRDVAEGQQTPSARRHKAALRAAKQAEHKRLRIAQEIQRQLEECEIKTKELEDKGIRVEKALRGETENVREETDLMRDWFSLVHERNALSRWEQELTVKARELQLEDRHMRLENELRQRMACPEKDKQSDDIEREGVILAEMLAILDQKDSLVSLLEEDRKRYVEEDKDLKKVMDKKGLRMSQRKGV